MSTQYDRYLEEHRANVKKGYDWIKENLPYAIRPGMDLDWHMEFGHDQSKNEPDEYEAYDAYFYGGNRSYKVVQDFRKAWMLHIHRNPHHWQYWILINDDPNEGEIVMDMPYEYILEMICDWWSFSWAKGDLNEIFNWWEDHEKYIKISVKTRQTVVDILSSIKIKLKEMDKNGD